MKITKAFIQAAILSKLSDIKSGKVAWNVGNQNDQYLLQSALDLLDINFDRALAWFSSSRSVDIMAWADFLADPCDVAA